MSYFEIGIYHPRNDVNVGTLWRSAYQLGAAGIFTVGKPYKRQTSDTSNTHVQIPLRCYETIEEMLAARPMGAVLVGVEIGGAPLAAYKHPQCAIYLLGSEDMGLPPKAAALCNDLIAIESVNRASYNVAVAGSIVMYHRLFLGG
ncbi:MAG: TrmH family RNA methyltransferase [Anaerolineaceae bacterium]